MPMMKRLFKLFISMFMISACTFGGGYVIVSLMKKKFVDEYHWVEQEEMLDLISIAQLSPGAVAVNGAITIGYRIAGILGMLIAVVATILPPFLIVSMLSVLYDFFVSNQLIQNLLFGMQAGIVAVIASSCFELIVPFYKERDYLAFLFMGLAFIAVVLFHINVFLVIVISLGIGIIGALK